MNNIFSILLLLQLSFKNLFIIAIAIIFFEIIAITKRSKLYVIQKKYLNFLGLKNQWLKCKGEKIMLG